MSICDCILVMNIQMYSILCVIFYLWSIRLMKKWLFPLIMPIKENNNHLINYLTILDISSSRYLFYLYYISKYKYSKWSPRCLFIRCSLPNTSKPNVFWILFYYQSTVTVLNLFDHVWWTLCGYSSMCIRLKWVDSDKLFRSILCFVDIYVIDNVH